MKTILLKRLLGPSLMSALWLLSTHLCHSYYSPGTGRWLSRDPIGELAGADLLAFCENNPLSRTDSDGRLVLERDPTAVSAFDRCNSIRLVYRISLSRTPPKASGYIVQHLRIRKAWWPCEIKDSPKPYDDRTEMWEAIQKVDVNDPSTWSVPDENRFDYCSYIRSVPGKGFIELSREVDFFESSVTGNLDELWTTPIPGFNTNPATTTRPSWWSWGFTGYEPAAKNKWAVTFNCCCPFRPARFHDSAQGPTPKYGDS